MKELLSSKVKYIVVHCTATREGVDYSVEDVRRWHKERHFSDIGYHYLIRRDGLIEVGRPTRYQGAHALGYNDKSIGVCYVGGLDANGFPKDTRTKEQKKWLKYLLRALKSQPEFGHAKIVGHRDLSPDKNGDGVISPDEWLKLCPCFDVQSEYNNIQLWENNDME